ncbi:MAG: competence/damage-inducible protein A [Acidimicrobiia bacterium]|nr:competence/damage-inducible protein A [Acidimicrobiia bacterium]
MQVEVIAIGTELLLGQIVNTNAAEIGARLAEAGLDHFHQVVVGDNLDRMADAITTALARADAVIITGGLGPTQDDMTRQAICAVTGRSMEFDQDHADHLAAWFARRGRELPESNLRQAEYPSGAELIPNAKGTAPGLRLEIQGTWLFALPGVPAELHPMLDDTVMPMLAELSGGNRIVVSRLLRTWGESESAISDAVADIYESLVNPTMAFLASGGEIKLRLTAAAETKSDAMSLIEPVEKQLRDRLGDLVFAVDSDTVETMVLDACGSRGWSLATAESATGGRIAARLTGVAGASKVFRGGIVAYNNDAKEDLLGVSHEMLVEVGAVSPETALAMAAGAAERLGADVVVAVTGSAGPEPQEQDVGTMIVAVRTPEASRARVIKMPGDRERVLTYTTTAALHLLRLAVTGAWSEQRWVPTTQ